MNFQVCPDNPPVAASHCQLLVSIAQPSMHHHSTLFAPVTHTLLDAREFLPGRLYCFGGGNKTSIFNDLWVLENPSSSSRSWRELPTGPPHRVWFGFAEGAGKLFVVNGMTDSSKFEEG